MTVRRELGRGSAEAMPSLYLPLCPPMPVPAPQGLLTGLGTPGQLTTVSRSHPSLASCPVPLMPVTK